MSLIFALPFVFISVLGFRASITVMGREFISGRQADRVAGLETVRGEPLLDLDGQLGVARDVDLAGTTTGPLARNHGATLEDLSTPDTPGLAPLHRTGE